MTLKGLRFFNSAEVFSNRIDAKLGGERENAFIPDTADIVTRNAIPNHIARSSYLPGSIIALDRPYTPHLDRAGCSDLSEIYLLTKKARKVSRNEAFMQLLHLRVDAERR